MRQVKAENFTESVVEDATLAWLESLSYAVLHGPHVAAGESTAERRDPMVCGKTSTDIHNCLLNAMRPYLEVVA